MEERKLMADDINQLLKVEWSKAQLQQSSKVNFRPILIGHLLEALHLPDHNGKLINKNGVSDDIKVQPFKFLLTKFWASMVFLLPTVNFSSLGTYS